MTSYFDLETTLLNESSDDDSSKKKKKRKKEDKVVSPHLSFPACFLVIIMNITFVRRS